VPELITGEEEVRFFGKAKRPAHLLAEAIIWAVPIHVRPGTEQLPPPLTGAYVQVFCRGDDATMAVWAAMQAVEHMGYSIPEIPTTANRLRASDYGQFIANSWPDLVDKLPDQAELYEAIAENRAVFGPFGGYEAPSK